MTYEICLIKNGHTHKENREPNKDILGGNL